MRISGAVHQTYNRNIHSARITGGCPHGNPAGACPICLGMGGGGGSPVKHKPTAHELGLLTWADLLPVWYAMLAAKNRKEYEATHQKLLEMMKLAEKTRLYQVLNNFINTKIMPAVKFIDSKILTPAAKAVVSAMKAINSFTAELMTYMTNRIAGTIIAINQKFNVFMEKLKNSLEMFKTVMERFISDLKEKEKDIKRNIAGYAKKIRESLLGIIQAISASLEHKNNRDGYKQDREIREKLGYE